VVVDRVRIEGEDGGVGLRVRVEGGGGVGLRVRVEG
jgi:hypothetical protein